MSAVDMRFNFQKLHHNALSFDAMIDVSSCRLCDATRAEFDEVVLTSMKNHSIDDLFVGLRHSGAKIIRMVFGGACDEVVAFDIDAWCEQRNRVLCDRLAEVVDDNISIFMAMSSTSFFQRTLRLVEYECCLSMEEFRAWGRIPSVVCDAAGMMLADGSFVGHTTEVVDPVFDDFESFYKVFNEVRGAYEDMIQTSLECVSIHQDIVIVFTPDWLDNVLYTGAKNLTRLLGETNLNWCHYMNAKLYLRLSSSMRTLTHLQFLHTMPWDLVSRRVKLNNLLGVELYNFMGSPWDVRGVCKDIFRVGFARVAFDVSPTDDICGHWAPDVNQLARLYVSNKQREALIIALLMGLHPRLGARSGLTDFHEVLLETILCEYVFVSDDGLSRWVESTSTHSNYLDSFSYIVA